MRRCIGYRKIGEEIRCKKRYSELVDPEIDADLGESIYLVDTHTRICVRGTPQSKETPRTPLRVGNFMSKRREACGKCRCRELLGFGDEE